MLDRATGGTLDLTGAARLTPGGGFGFTDLLASGQHGSARLNGEYGRDKVDARRGVEIPQTQVLDPRVSGKAEIAGALSGTPSDLTAALKANLGEGRLLRPQDVRHRARRARQSRDRASSTRTLPFPEMSTATLSKGRRMSHNATTEAGLSTILRSASLRRGSPARSRSAQTSWRWRRDFQRDNLDDLSPLVLTKLTGALEAKANASAAEGKQMLSVAANSDRMTIGANRLEGLKVDFKVADLWGAKIISGFAQLARAEVARQSITGVS